MIAVIIASAFLTGCAGASAHTSATTAPSQTTLSEPLPKPTVDDMLVGYWTIESSRLKVSLQPGKAGTTGPDRRMVRF